MHAIFVGHQRFSSGLYYFAFYYFSSKTHFYFPFRAWLSDTNCNFSRKRLVWLYTCCQKCISYIYYLKNIKISFMVPAKPFRYGKSWKKDCWFYSLPLNPGAQVQLKSATWSRHVPPLWQGFDQQSFQSVSQCSPVYPSSQ